MDGFPITLAMTQPQRGPDTSEMRHGRTTSARVKLGVKPTDIGRERQNDGQVQQKKEDSTEATEIWAVSY